MNTFKVGDKVRLIESGKYNYSKFKVGDTFIIKEIACEKEDYLRSTKGEHTGVHYTYCELVVDFKVGDIVTIGDSNTLYRICELFDGCMAKICHLKNGNRYDYNLNKLKKYIPKTNIINQGSYDIDVLTTGPTLQGTYNEYLPIEEVSLNKQLEKTLPTNNNTMEKLNQLRADKFFANEKNLTAIESLDTLLKDSIELTKATQREMFNVETKLLGLNKKLESATNNQDVATLKDLITSTKVIQEFVDNLKDKTISKFEKAKSTFDVAGYLKD